MRSAQFPRTNAATIVIRSNITFPARRFLAYITRATRATFQPARYLRQRSMVEGIDVRPLSKRMRVLQLLGVLLFVPSAFAFYHFVDRGTDTPLVYLTGVSMYVGLALALYATLMLWGDD